MTHRKKLIERAAWCAYDFANSSYSTVIVTVAYSVYFIEVVAVGHDAERVWGWGYSGSMLVVALLGPLLGAVADYAGLKKTFLTSFTLLCITATLPLYFIGAGDVLSGILLFAVSNAGYNLALAFYNSFLVDLADKKEMGRLSGYGWAFGYVGGLFSLLTVYPLTLGGTGAPGYRLIFPITALFFLVASIPTFIWLKERDNRPRADSRYLGEGFRRIALTFHEIRRFKPLMRYFIAYFVYTDAINTIAVFSAIFASKVLSFTASEIVVYFILTQISAALGSAIFGHVTDRFGAKNSIICTLVIWIGVALAAYMVETKTGFYAIGFFAGAALGSNQSASRALLALMTPHGKNAEFFGFFSLAGKLAAVTGPIIYGEIASGAWGHRGAVLTLAIFFAVGLLLLAFVDEKKGIENARKFEDII
jgi:UMF1 family MFS transporter